LGCITYAAVVARGKPCATKGDAVPLRAIVGGAAEAAPEENHALASAVSDLFLTAGRKSLNSKEKMGWRHRESNLF